MDNQPTNSGWVYICPSCGEQVEQGSFHVCNMRWEPRRGTELTEIIGLLREILDLLKQGVRHG